MCAVGGCNIKSLKVAVSIQIVRCLLARGNFTSVLVLVGLVIFVGLGVFAASAFARRRVPGAGRRPFLLAFLLLVPVRVVVHVPVPPVCVPFVSVALVVRPGHAVLPRALGAVPVVPLGTFGSLPELPFVLLAFGHPGPALTFAMPHLAAPETLGVDVLVFRTVGCPVAGPFAHEAGVLLLLFVFRVLHLDPVAAHVLGVHGLHRLLGRLEVVLLDECLVFLVFDEHDLAELAEVAFHFLLRDVARQSAHLNPVHIAVLPRVIAHAIAAARVTACVARVAHGLSLVVARVPAAVLTPVPITSFVPPRIIPGVATAAEPFLVPSVPGFGPRVSRIPGVTPAPFGFVFSPFFLRVLPRVSSW